MKEWLGNAHGDHAARRLKEKIVGRFDSRGGWGSTMSIPWRIDSSFPLGFAQAYCSS